MFIKKQNPVLILRISNFRSFSFVEEHTKLLAAGEGVWILKTGKLIPEKALSSIIEAGGTLFLRTPKKQGGRWYLSHFDKYRIGEPSSDMNYPAYYQLLCSQEEIQSLYGTWKQKKKIEEVGEDVVSHLTLRANGHSVLDIINTTRTAYLYAESDVNIDVHTNKANREIIYE